MEQVQIDLLAIFIAAIVYMTLALLWYSPLLMGKIWAKLTQRSVKNKWVTFFCAFINALILSFFLAILLGFLRVNTVIDGFFVGFGVWLGFVATTQFSLVLWERRSFKLYLIDNAFWFVGFSVIGAILGA